jgi:hypothetical protein
MGTERFQTMHNNTILLRIEDKLEFKMHPVSEGEF